MATAAPITTQTARPAEPLLASQLISDDALSGCFASALDLVTGTRTVPRVEYERPNECLSTGSKSVDVALRGGLRAGEVCAVWSDGGGVDGEKGGGEMTSVLLANSLLRYKDSSAAVIDATGNFDIMKLYSTILGKIRGENGLYENLKQTKLDGHGQDDDENQEGVAARLLDRVKIMRVFDFVGVREAIEEIREELDGRRDGGSASEEKEDKPRGNKGIQKEVEVEMARTRPEKKPQRTYIPDSEEEDEEDDMLFETQPEHESAVDDQVAVLNSEPQTHTEPGPATPPKNQAQLLQPPTPVKFILIDNLTQVLNPLLKRDYVQTHVLTSTFLPTLANLTRTHALYTILLNPCTTPHPPSATTLTTDNPANPPQLPSNPATSARNPPKLPSIFASNRSLPSLLPTLQPHATLGLLVSRMPRGKRDARVYYADEANGATGARSAKMRGVKMGSVVEVLWDREGMRVGDWGVLETR